MLTNFLTWTSNRTYWYIFTGLPITDEALDEVRELSGVMDVGEDFLDADVRRECERIVPEIDQVKPADAADTYLFLKHHYGQSEHM